MKLSIIVPIYNVEEYIARCALSLLHQTASEKEFEVVFVNDGTKDNSIKILSSVIDFSKYKNFHIIHKQNGGLSSARNYGIDHSSGDYIWFVDSDDWVDDDSVAVLLDYIKTSPDIVATTQMYRNIGDSQTNKYTHSCNFHGSGPDLIRYMPPICSVAYICKRTFWKGNNFTFKEGILHEDSELIPRLVYSAKSIVAIDRPLYHHYMRENSITNVINPHRYDSLFIVLDSLCNFYQYYVSIEHKKSFARMFAAQFYGLLFISINAEKEIKIKVIKYISANKTISQIMRKNPSIQSNLMGVVIEYLPEYTLIIASFIWKIKKSKIF